MKRPSYKLTGIINEPDGTERDFNHTLQLTPHGIGDTIRMILDHNKDASSFVLTITALPHRTITKM